MINVKLCVVVVLTVLCLFTLLSFTLIVFQGHSSVKHFKLQSLVLSSLVEILVGLLITSSRS